MTAFLFSLLEYIGKEKEITMEETRRRSALSRDEKIGEGLLLPDLIVVSSVSGAASSEYVLRFRSDSMRLRPGERISLADAGGASFKATVLEVGFDTITVAVPKGKPYGLGPWDAESLDSPLYDGFLSALSSIGEFDPGAVFLEYLSGKASPRPERPLGADPAVLSLAERYGGGMDASQREAILAVARQPSLHLVQGPPGTGKTRVLASLASSFSEAGVETAVVAKTHQAVNNALNAILKLSPGLTVVKIGQMTRSEGLSRDVHTFDTFGSYLSWRKASKRKRGSASDIVGMTLNASAVNMCVRNSGFKPDMILVDEASQIPVAEAAMLGASGASSVAFFGDDRQMPPIFLPGLESDPLSESVFSLIRRLYPAAVSVLGVSYRMNDEICSLVSGRFYEPFGIHIKSSSAAAPRRMVLDGDTADSRIAGLFGPDTPSVVRVDVSRQGCWTDSNPEEADFAAGVAGYAMRCGVRPCDIAVVTPFRRQAVLVRGALDRDGWKGVQCPLVDTVERLQGQDVRLVILSFSVTDPVYLSSVRGFLEDRNRLNVMVSRAKEKVVILGGGQGVLP